MKAERAAKLQKGDAFKTKDGRIHRVERVYAYKQGNGKQGTAVVDTSGTHYAAAYITSAKPSHIRILAESGAENIEGYSLINNYGYTFTIKGKKCDARYWANCYGAALNVWQVDGDIAKTKRRLIENKLNEYERWCE